MSAAEFPDPEWEGLLDRVDNDPESVEAGEGVVLTMADAVRAMRQLARLDAQAEAVDAAAREEIARVTAWVTAEHERRAHRRAFLVGRLEAFHRARYEADGKAAISIPLAHGRLESKAGQAAWEYEDEAAFLAWARKNRRDLVRWGKPTPDAPDKNAVKAAFGDRVKDGQAVTEDGEVVPGVVVNPPERTFKVVPHVDGAS